MTGSGVLQGGTSRDKGGEINLTDQISVLIHVSEASTTFIKCAIVLLTVFHRLGQFRMRVEKQSFILTGNTKPNQTLLASKVAKQTHQQRMHK